MHEQLSEIYEEPLDQIRGYYTELSNELDVYKSNNISRRFLKLKVQTWLSPSN